LTFTAWVDSIYTRDEGRGENINPAKNISFYHRVTGFCWSLLVASQISSQLQPRGTLRDNNCIRLRLKCDGKRAETRFRLSAKRTSPFTSAGASVQSTTGSRGLRIGGSNAGYTMFRGSVKSTGYSLLSPVSPSLPLPCVTVCHHISTELYLITHTT
jgi:hypothetical protein